MDDYTEVFVWGSNQKGQLGIGRTGQSDCIVPRFCSFQALIRSVACGEEHSLFITRNAEVYSMGCNTYGQLGLGHDQSVFTPQCVQALSQIQIVQVACGGGHSFAVSSEGSAYSWGRGDSGALGLGTLDSQTLPRLIRTQSSFIVSQVSCGSRHTALLGITSESKGLLLMCGAGEAGQLGTGRREREVVPVRAADLVEIKQVSCGVIHTACVTYTGAVYTMGANNLGQLGVSLKKAATVPTLVKTLEGIFIEKVACGHHTAAISDEGDLFLWGSGTFGQFSTPCKVNTLPVALQDISVCQSSGLGLDVNQKVWTWGSNTSGQLGVGDFQGRGTPSPVGALQGKQVVMAVCGGTFVLALGRDVKSTTISPFSPEVVGPQIRKVRNDDQNTGSLMKAQQRVRDLAVESIEEENLALKEAMEKMRVDLEVTVQDLQSISESSRDQVKELEIRLVDEQNRSQELSSLCEDLQRRLDLSEKESLEKEEELARLYEDHTRLQAAYDQVHMQNGYLLKNVREESAVKDRLQGLVKELETEKESLKMRKFRDSAITPDLLSKAREYKEYSVSILQTAPQTSRSRSMSPQDLTALSRRNSEQPVSNVRKKEPQEEKTQGRSQLSPLHQRNLAQSAQRSAGNSLAELKEKLKALSKRPNPQASKP